MQLRPTLVIEFGTFQGGSALYFATVLSALPPPASAAAAAPHKFKIITVDIHGHLLHPTVAADPRIEAVVASSTAPAVEQRIRQLLQQYVAPLSSAAAAYVLLQISRPRVRDTGQRPQQSARAAGAARHCALDVQGRSSGCRGQVRGCAAVCCMSADTASSNVNGHPVGLSHGPGPYEAIEAYMQEAPDVFVGDAAAEGKFGFTAAPAGWLVRA